MPSAVIVESCAYTLEEVDHSIFLFSYDCHLGLPGRIYTEASARALALRAADVEPAWLACALGRVCPLAGIGEERDAATTNLRTPETSTATSCDACATPACNAILFPMPM